MKYAKEIYETAQYFKPAKGSKIFQKVVKVNYSHPCILCSSKNCTGSIEKGEYAVNQRAYLNRNGVVTSHICISCAEQWIEATTKFQKKDGEK